MNPVVCPSMLPYFRSWFSSALVALTVSIGAMCASGQDISLLQTGRQLESERRWHEAIQVYEKAIRRDVENSQIAERLQTARVHFDVVRRYSDRSFIDTVKRSTPAEALDIYGEVIAKLEAYFVEAIDYPKLALYGTACLEISLTEQDFLNTHLPNARRESIDGFRTKVHQTVVGRRIASAAELRSMVSQIAVQAQQQIGLTPSATIYEMMAGAVCMLDPYSAFLTPGEYREIMSQIEGNLIGLGVELWAEGTELRIIDVFKASPAYEAGLRAGHYILEVDGQSVLQIGAKRAADMLRGTEGSRVQLVISNGGESTVPLQVVRKRVEIPSVSAAEMRDEGVGYIRVTNFQKTTVQEVGQAMFQLSREGMKSLVIDLRRNPGGLLESAVELADEFLSQGRIVSTRGRNGEENRNYAAKPQGTWDIPLVVLIDGDSASASEIFAGAIRDHNRGYVVGQVSYGKGSVQGVFHNERGQGGLRLTVSKFFSPSGTAISARGIVPHILVPEDLSASQNRTALRPNVEGSKLVAQFQPSEETVSSSRSLTARRPDVDSSDRESNPPSPRDATMEKGLQVAREMLLQTRSR
ncbi:MAG: S41 family peptidase [Planctomycetota bacterium]|jgi:carboxyl-terminal processing protease